MNSKRPHSARPRFQQIGQQLLRRLTRAVGLTLATGFGSGFVPKAPGTAGSVMAVVIWWFLPPMTPLQIFILLALLLLVATWAAVEAERYFNKKDPGMIVIDEVLGFFIAAIPAAKEPGLLLMSFLLFRIFDILKPYPANRWDHLSKKAGSPWLRGLAINVDDVIAGIYAGALTWGAKLLIS